MVSEVVDQDDSSAHREDSLPQVYQVQPGDTLSVLAGRFLGSSRRYLELYEANRDVLSSPDDLQVGMLLKIPGPGSSQEARAGRAQRPGAGRSHEQTLPRDNRQESSFPPRFQPVPAPFVAPSETFGFRD